MKFYSSIVIIEEGRLLFSLLFDRSFLLITFDVAPSVATTSAEEVWLVLESK